MEEFNFSGKKKFIMELTYSNGQCYNISIIDQNKKDITHQIGSEISGKGCIILHKIPQ
jgi:hypothetical protein